MSHLLDHQGVKDCVPSCVCVCVARFTDNIWTDSLAFCVCFALLDCGSCRRCCRKESNSKFISVWFWFEWHAHNVNNLRPKCLIHVLVSKKNMMTIAWNALFMWKFSKLKIIKKYKIILNFGEKWGIYYLQ